MVSTLLHAAHTNIRRPQNHVSVSLTFTCEPTRDSFMHLVCTQSYSQHSHSPLTSIIATSRVAPFARPPHMHVILICQSPRLSQRAASRHSVRWQLLRMNPGLCLFVCAHCCGLRRVFVNRVGLSAPSHAQSCNELHITVLCTAPRPLSLICVCLAGATSKSIADAHRQL